MAFLPKNNQQLQQLFAVPLREVVEIVAQKIWNENRDVVRKVVYDAGTPKYYERTNEFRNDAWGFEKPAHYTHGHIAEYRFFYDWEKMTIDRDKAQHGSPPHTTTYSDVRPYLADIIYAGQVGNRGMLFGDGYWRKARNAWKELLSTLGKKKMKEMFTQAFEYCGIDVESHMNVALETWDEE